MGEFAELEEHGGLRHLVTHDGKLVTTVRAKGGAKHSTKPEGKVELTLRS